MTIGLPISKLISVSSTLAAAAAQAINFNSLLILGDSNVVNVKDRLRLYSSLTAIGTDFGQNAPEFLAARDFFAQAPQPPQVFIGRWAKTATAGLNLGGVLSTTQQAMSNWTTIVAGSFKVAIDGSAVTNVPCGSFAAAGNLNAVAAIIQTALRAIATGGFTLSTCTWNAASGQFQIASGTTGATSTVSALTAGNANDFSAQLLMTAGTLSELVAGIGAESALAAVTTIDAMATQWYGLTFAAGVANVDISDADYQAVAAYIEAAPNPHLFGITTSEAQAAVSPDTTSIGAVLKTFGYNRTGFQWSSTDPYAVCSALGKLLTTNFLANTSTITLAWQTEPGVQAETLTSAQAAALDANNYMYFANFNNATAIIVNATVASGHFFDEIIGVDWLVNFIQTNLFNTLAQAGTKIPQTDDGMNILATSIEASLTQSVNNGLLGPGTWTAAGFGQLKTGQYLANAWYVFAPPIATQAASARAARQSVPFQIAAKLAGAVHGVSASLVVNQ